MYARRTPVLSLNGHVGRNGRDAQKSAAVLVRLDGSIASWDDGARAMFGWSPHEVVGLPFFTLFTEESRDAVDGLWRAGPCDPVSVSATGCDRSGTDFETEMTASRTLAVRDGAVGFVALVRDMTEQRAAANALFACTGARDSAAAVAAVRTAVEPWVQIADLSLGDAHGPRFRRPPGAGCLQMRLSLESDGRAGATLDVVFAEPRQATPRAIRVLCAVARAIGPSIARTIELEEQSRAIGQLRRNDRLEKEFLALITHDMRTPLAVIAGFASNLRDNWDELPDGQRLEGLDAILRNGRSLTRLVEQDLQLASMDANQLRYDMTAFDIASEIEWIVGDVVRTTGRRISLRVEGPLPLVTADRQRNAQVLANLLSNAVKFSPRHTLVDVEAFQRSTEVHVVVHDRGRGISRGDQLDLFRKFSRPGASRSAATPGTGLGLYLCKCMVEAQGGRIWVESRPGRGATFTYTLPVAPPASNGRG
jgi:PAS domain S-box-containing protein